MDQTAYPVTVGMIVVTQTREGWELRPTPAAAQLQLCLFTLVSAIPLTGAYLFWRLADDAARIFFALPIFVFALQLLGRGLWGWSLRARPLIVEDCGGRVSYCDRELCAAHTVESVRVVPDPRSESDGYKVSLLLSNGMVIELPAPYFDSFLTRLDARAFALQFARLLDVGIVEAEEEPFWNRLCNALRVFRRPTAH